MAQLSTNEFRAGIKLEIEGQPYIIVTNEFVKPGKGQAFNRVRLKHLLTGRVVDRTYKSGETAEVADVEEVQMRLLYREGTEAVFMDDQSFEQVTLSEEKLTEVSQWLKEEELYTIVVYKGVPVAVTPPTFMELEIVESAPGVRGDTASGRVLKPALLSTGAKVQVPIFIEQGEVIKVDTRTSEYVSRVNK